MAKIIEPLGTVIVKVLGGKGQNKNYQITWESSSYGYDFINLFKFQIDKILEAAMLGKFK